MPGPLSWLRRRFRRWRRRRREAASDTLAYEFAHNERGRMLRRHRRTGRVEINDGYEWHPCSTDQWPTEGPKLRILDPQPSRHRRR